MYMYLYCTYLGFTVLGQAKKAPVDRPRPHPFLKPHSYCFFVLFFFPKKD